jgi:hypothetical protein
VKLDGRDILPVLLGDGKVVHEDILINAAPGTGALRRGDWKLVINGQLLFKAESPGPNFSWTELGPKSGLSAEETARQQVELFNLKNDPGESRNLADQHPEILRELMKRYEAYAMEAAPLLDGTVGDETVPAVWGEFPDKS